VVPKQGHCHRPALHPTENWEPVDKPGATNNQSRQQQDRPFHQAANTTAKQGLEHGSLAGRQQAASLDYSNVRERGAGTGRNWTASKCPTIDFSGPACTFLLTMLDFTSRNNLARDAEETALV
jgi:hypothetical protein